MNRGYLLKLSLSNIKSNKQIIFPYILTCILNISMFYNMIALTIDKELSKSSVQFVLGLGVIVIAFFSVIFTFYTNSFLVKRRLKEFGLYNILGLEKKHISKIVFYETLIISLISLFLGIITGILFNKVFGMLLIKLAGLNVDFGFKLSIGSIFATLIIFVGIFVLNLLNTIRHVYKSSPIELLKGSEVGEKEPKIKWVTLVVGCISLLIAYYISQTVKSPLDAIGLFFVAVILVIIATHCLFQAGSIALLKMLKNNKNFYYKIQNFTSVSSLMYRMKQNASGLANICILSTMVLVMLSSTVCLYLGLNDSLNTMFLKQFQINTSVKSRDEFKQSIDNFNEKMLSKGIEISNGTLMFKAFTMGDLVDNNYQMYTGSQFKMGDAVIFIDLKQFNKNENSNYVLNKDEVLIFPLDNKYNFDTFIYNDKTYKVKEVIKKIDGYTTLESRIMPTYYVVVDDIFEFSNDELRILAKYDFDASEDNVAFMNESFENGYVMGKEDSRKEFMSLNGTFFFLGIFLGTIFIIATCLIIYYKQLQEGYDDKKRYEIMQKVGMDHSTIKSSINKQVLIVFFMPLIFAIIHIGFAFKMISKLLLIIGVYNPTLFVYCILATILIFSLIYLLIYKLTSRVYYNIVQM